MPKIPEALDELKRRMKQAQVDAKHYEKLSIKKDNEVFMLTVELQKICNHKYKDGSTAWENRYAYGYCQICLYSDY